MESAMEEVSVYILMAAGTLEITEITRGLAMEHSSIKMVARIQESGN